MNMRAAREETKTDRTLALVATGGADTILNKKQVAAMIDRLAPRFPSWPACNNQWDK
jgi:hypothetical protein